MPLATHPTGRPARPASSGTRRPARFSPQPAAARRTRCPCPGRLGLDRARRASPPGRCTRVSPMPSPPCDRSSERSTCVNSSKTRGSMLRRDADARVPHRAPPPRRRRCPPSARSCPPGSVYFAALFSRLRQHLRQPDRVALHARAARGGSDTVELVAAGVDQRAARLHRAARSTSASVDRLACAARSCRA